MISEHHLAGMLGYVAEAGAAGAKGIEVSPAGDNVSRQSGRKMVPTLIVDPPDRLEIMNEEIFGPVLAIKTCTDLDSVIAKIKARPHALAVCVFAAASVAERVLSRTRSGGVLLNDVFVQVMQGNLPPFGGVGNSGMGAYHAGFGVGTFSDARSVYRRTRRDPMQLLVLPYVERARRIPNLLIKRKSVLIAALSAPTSPPKSRK